MLTYNLYDKSMGHKAAHPSEQVSNTFKVPKWDAVHGLWSIYGLSFLYMVCMLSLQTEQAERTIKPSIPLTRE